MNFLKKILHYFCFFAAATLWVAVLAVIYRLFCLILFQIDPVQLQTYRSLAGFWNTGGVLRGKDVLLLLVILSYFPLVVWGICKLFYYQYMRLITVPLNKFANRGLDGYVAPEVNIKNLKIEEKKTLEQVVQERLKEEQKKVLQNTDGKTDFRQKIIEQLEETKM